MAQTERSGWPASPVSVLVNGVRQAVNGFDFRLITQGLAAFGKPGAAGFLDMLGSTDEERVEALAAMLRNSSEAEMEEMVDLFARAMALVAEEKAQAPEEADEVDAPTRRAERPRRRPGQSSAEWRQERRRAT